jgi:hypothetical protein
MQYKLAITIVMTVVALTTTGCATLTPPADTLLHFTEQDRGGTPYATRMLVSKDYLRIDDVRPEEGGDAGFVLLDRKARTIYSVSPGDKTILVIKPLPITLQRPAVFALSVERDKEALPHVDGKSVVHYRLLTGQEACMEVYAAAGLLPHVVTALREYHEILAGEQAQTEMHILKVERSLCDLADLVFAPARYLDHGFPVRQVSHNGHARQLVDYKINAVLEEGWFSLPQDYRRYSIGDMVPRQ